MMARPVPPARKQTLVSIILMAFTGLLIWLQWRFLTNGFLMTPRWSDLDGQHWLFAVITRLRGGGFTNDLTVFPTHFSAVDGDFSLVGYPPVHLLAMYLLSNSPDIFGVLFATAVVKGTALTMICLLFLMVIKRSEKSASASVWTGTFVLLVIFFLLDFGGRPEATLTIFLVLFLIYSVWCDWEGNPWILGGLLGVMGATAPTAALLVSCLSITLVGIKSDLRRGVWTLVKMAAAAAMTFLLLLELRYGIPESLKAIHEGLTAQGFAYPSWRLFIETNLLDWYRPLFGIVFALGAVILGLSYKRFRPQSPSLFVLGIALFSVIGYSAFYSRPHCTYNILALTPIILLAILVALMRLTSARLLIVAVLILPMTGFLVQIGLFLDYENRGLSLNAARRVVHEITRGFPSTVQIGIDYSLWPLADSIDDWSRAFLLYGKSSSETTSKAVLILKEGFGVNYGGSLKSPPLTHITDPDRGIDHRLIVDCNRRDTMSFFGRAIYQPIFGFGFSIYVPTALTEDFAGSGEALAAYCRFSSQGRPVPQQIPEETARARFIRTL